MDGQIPPVFYRTSFPSGPLSKKACMNHDLDRAIFVSQHWHSREVCGVETIVRYECCTGFAQTDAASPTDLRVDAAPEAGDREDEGLIGKGCSVTLPLTSLHSTLQQLHYNAFNAESVESFKRRNRGIAFTLFVPSNDAIRRETQV